MSYTKPFMDGDNVPDQPIPLRLVPFITGWDFRTMLELFSAPDCNARLPIAVYQYNVSSEPGVVHANILRDLLKETSAVDSIKDALQLIRNDYFIMSSALSQVNFMYQDLYLDRDMSDIEPLVWNPAVGDCVDLIKECSDFINAQPSVIKMQLKNRGRKASTEEQYNHIFDKARLLREKHRGYNVSDIARLVARDAAANPNNLESETIRKELGKNKEKWDH